MLGGDHADKNFLGQTFDARPDRIDFRDHAYSPPLRSLPPSYPSEEAIARFLPLYQKHGMVLDQQNEGACTGFGLAAVVNYLRWEAWLRSQPVPPKGKPFPDKDRPKPVSPRMIYQNARLYDEWKGEDYEGSSCRGAMKGFHKHGICTETSWPYREADGSIGRSRPEWDKDAAECPLGSYYRVEARSLVDMQAAIAEVHAIYVSGTVHEGWDLKKHKRIDAAKIEEKPKPENIGGHAYSIVGYRPEGFIVQNSWGPDWGFHGFAILPYEEWVRHGQDAWVLALGAPMLAPSPRTRTALSLERRAASRAPILAKGSVAGEAFGVSPWVEGQEALKCVFVGHGGRADREIVSGSRPRRRGSARRRACRRGSRQKWKNDCNLRPRWPEQSRDSGVNRARILGPWLQANRYLADSSSYGRPDFWNRPRTS